MTYKLTGLNKIDSNQKMKKNKVINKIQHLIQIHSKHKFKNCNKNRKFLIKKRSNSNKQTLQLQK